MAPSAIRFSDCTTDSVLFCEIYIRAMWLCQSNATHRGANIIVEVLRELVADPLLGDQLRFIFT